MLKVHVKDLGLPNMAKRKRTKRKRDVHADGSICEYGIRNVPRGWKPCCEALNFRTKQCMYDVRIQWFTKQKSWGVRVTDGGDSFITIHYCPFCGTRLEPASQGDGRMLVL